MLPSMWILHLFKSIYNAEKWLCMFQMLSPWQAPVTVSHCQRKLQIYHGNWYWTCCTAETHKPMSTLISHQSWSRERELPDCIPSTRRCFGALFPEDQQSPLLRLMLFLTPCTASLLSVAPARQLCKKVLDLAFFFQFRRWYETISGGSGFMGKDF